ncbi:hypothetical protein ACOMHN_031097 [Nucella lapillus]
MPERESYCRRFFRWRKTSKKELQNVDEQVLRSVHSIKEKKYIPVGGDNQLWSVTSNPHHPSIPILMVHGMGGGVGLWAMNLDPLTRHRPVHAFDLLGFGRSSRPSFSSDAIQAEETFVQAIEDYRKAMGLDRFILVGHSLGGYLSASYALQHPQHVAHLVLADPWGMTPHPRGAPHTCRSSTGLAAGPLGPRLLKRFRPELARMFAAQLGDESLLHDYIYHCNAQKPSGERGFKSLTWNVGWAKRPMIERMVALTPDLPVTFIYGSHSWMNRDAAWGYMKTREQGYVDVEIIRGAGHHVYAERWDAFNSLVNTIASCVDRGELPSLNRKIVTHLHTSPLLPSGCRPKESNSEDIDTKHSPIHPTGFASDGEDSLMKSRREPGRGECRHDEGGDQKRGSPPPCLEVKVEGQSENVKVRQIES